ncbi:hypothetical protein J6590_025934 [Homalodisca vitripennis]|nr:hypothetical protein J6590_025934 [Homalodisca vitripennis]
MWELDRGLTWDNHIDHACAEIASEIFALRNLAQYCSIGVLKTAYFCLIYPHLGYGIKLWVAEQNTSWNGSSDSKKEL